MTNMNNLACERKRQGRNVEAIEFMKECVRLKRHILGTTHLDYIESLGAFTSWETENAKPSSLTLDRLRAA